MIKIIMPIMIKKKHEQTYALLHQQIGLRQNGWHQARYLLHARISKNKITAHEKQEKGASGMRLD